MTDEREPFQSVVVKPCTSANTPHLRYEVTHRDGTSDGWCAGRAPMHMSQAAYAQLADSRDRYERRNPPGTAGGDAG